MVHFIGLLTLVASLLGTLGGAGGTGLLLAVSIVYRLYEDIASEQMMEMHPMIRSFFGQDKWGGFNEYSIIWSAWCR